MMYRDRHIIGPAQGFLDHLQCVTTNSELFNLMECICHELGFRYFALIHHTDLRDPNPDVVNITNYPPVWADHFVEQRLYRFDPVVHACFRTNVGFRWSSLSRLIKLNARHRSILEGAAREGLTEGLTVPSCIKGEYVGSCSLAAPHSEKQFERCALIGQLIGAFGFEAARRLAKSSTVDFSAALSPRQRECVVLVGRGKTNWEIAMILGLSPVTIGHYLSDARLRYNVTTRQQLVVRALLEGEVSFAEIMPTQYVQMNA